MVKLPDFRSNTFKYGIEILLYSLFIMWVLSYYVLELYDTINNFNIFKLARVILIMIALRYLFVPVYVLGARFMEATGAKVLAEGYKDEVRKLWTVE